MKNSTFFCFVFLFTIIGIFIGYIVFINTPKPSQDVLAYKNFEKLSGDNIANGDSLLTHETFSGEEIQLEEKTETKISPNNIKSVYLTGWTTGNEAKRKNIVNNLKQHNFNAVVIDIKDEAGRISYPSKIQTAIDIKASQNMIKNIENVIEDFHNSDIYVIGRIVTFKDPLYAKNIPQNAYQNSDGSIWKDYSNNNWPNPYNKNSWEYPISLAKEAASLGFDEIQFDYIRFPSSEGRVKNISFGFDSDTKTKSQIINEFLTYTTKQLKEYNVIISADVFGITTKKAGDFENIGQDFLEIAKIVDVICPMVYPSHYGKGEYGIIAPDTKPYEIIYGSLNDALSQYSSQSGDNKLATIRPYLQDFTASWLKKGNYINYNTTAVTAQLQACYDLGINDFTLWDPSNKYAYEALSNIKIPIASGDINLRHIASGNSTTTPNR